MKNKKGFTLIELLAIIVILAIIAVITVPIILNIIENSKKGASVDSAYGYKDSVQQYYLAKSVSDNNSEVLDGEFIKDVSQLESDGITVSGQKPSEGWIRINKGQVVDYSLVFGDYTVNFNNVNNAPEATKNGELKSKPSLVDTCPGENCFYSTSGASIGDSLPVNNSQSYTDFYNEFLAYILDNQTGKISRSFVCGKENNEYFCLEGKDASKFNDNNEIANDIYSTCAPYQYHGEATEDTWCSSTSNGTNALIGKNGKVQTVSGFYFCQVNENGDSECHSI